VNVALNAAKGPVLDFMYLPVHLALRKVLECASCAEAVAVLKRVSVAIACHILIANKGGSMGLECTAEDIVRLGPRITEKGRKVVTHTNHFVETHREGANSPPDSPDSPFRLARIDDLLGKEIRELSFETVEEILRDEEGFPGGICREGSAEDGFATLFSVVMDLGSWRETLRWGGRRKKGGG
jgi:isopenicillin-N N-acyltransferase like protein